MYLVDDHLIPSLGILHIHVIFWNSYNIRILHWCNILIGVLSFYISPFIFLSLQLWFYVYKKEHWVVCKTHNNRESPQEVAQSAGTTTHEAEVTSSNPLFPSYVDMSKNKKNNREESYLVLEELVSYIVISLSCLVIIFIFFYFTTLEAYLLLLV